MALVVCGNAAPQYPLPLAPWYGAPLAAYTAISAAPGSYSYTAGPAAYALPSPIAIAIAPAPATYTAINRGTIHTAPLPGHVESAASVNLEAAPGTA